MNFNNKEDIMVSVVVTTYNHEQYIGQALDGILKQDVNFRYEIIVHDDASPDKTPHIIRKYESENIDKMKVIYQQQNKYQQGISLHQFYSPLLRGKYVAICEGDDYWTDSKKLHKQVNFLEDNPEYIASYHNVRVIDENYNLINTKSQLYELFSDYIYTYKHAQKGKLPGQTASIVYRNIWNHLDNNIIEGFRSCKANGDEKLALLLSLQGEIYCSSDIMADHRRIKSIGTSWTARTHNKNMLFEKYISELSKREFVKKNYHKDFNNIQARLRVIYKSIILCIKKPRRENIIVLKKILGMKKDNKLLIVLYFLGRITITPILVVKRRYL